MHGVVRQSLAKKNVSPKVPEKQSLSARKAAEPRSRRPIREAEPLAFARGGAARARARCFERAVADGASYRGRPTRRSNMEKRGSGRKGSNKGFDFKSTTRIGSRSA